MSPLKNKTFQNNSRNPKRKPQNTAANDPPSSKNDFSPSLDDIPELQLESFTTEVGLKTTICHTELPYRASILLYVDAGSQSDDPPGCAHMLEHLIFRGSSKLPSLRKLSEAFENIGADFNASTARDYTCYELSLPSETILPALELLADVILNPKLLGIRQERNIIREEILADYDDPNDDTSLINPEELLCQCLLGQAAKPVAGNPSDLNKIDRSHILRFYQNYYNIHFLHLFIVGNIHNQKKIINTINAAFYKLKKLHNNSNKLTLPIDTPYANQRQPRSPKIPRIKPQLHIKHYDGSLQSDFALGILSFPPKHPKFATLEMLLRILDDGMAARLFVKLVDELALVYNAEADCSAALDFSLFEIRLSCRHQQCAKLVDAVYHILQDLAAKALDQDELLRIKNRMLWEQRSLLDNPNALASWLCNAHRLQLPPSLHTHAEALLNVQAQDIQELARTLLYDSALVLILVGDLKGKRAKLLHERFEATFASPTGP